MEHWLPLDRVQPWGLGSGQGAGSSLGSVGSPLLGSQLAGSWRERVIRARIRAAAASTGVEAATVTPKEAVNQIEAALVRPWTWGLRPFLLPCSTRISPAPRQPTPVATPWIARLRAPRSGPAAENRQAHAQQGL